MNMSVNQDTFNSSAQHSSVDTMSTSKVSSGAAVLGQRPRLRILAAIAILLIVAGTLYAVTNRNKSTASPLSTQNEVPVATVGAETIFQADIEQNKPLYPAAEDVEKLALNGLIRQSVIIQAAAEQGWIDIDEQTFNTPRKNQYERTQLVKEVENIFNENRSRVEGSLVAIYFLNEFPGPIGYEAGRQLAETKMRDIYSKLRSGSMTMQQAGVLISDDTELERVDIAYQSNAYLEFSIGTNQQVINDPAVNERILSLREGEMSEILTAKSLDLSTIDFSSENHYAEIEQLEPVDAFFLIAQVDKRVDGLNYESFEDWVAEQMENYSINHEI